MSRSNGIIGPGDPAPDPESLSAGVWDYRSVARASDIAQASKEFPLGKLREPGKWTANSPFGLPDSVANEHLMVVGPTRSGKTASIIAPWIYESLSLGYSVIAIDVKGQDDLLDEVKQYSQTRGQLGVPVVKWDYADPQRSVSWNWIAELTDDGKINAAVDAICGRPSPSDPNKFFHQSAIKYLRGLLQLSPTISGSMTVASLLNVLNDQSRIDDLVRSRQGHPGASRISELTGLSPGDYLKQTMELKTYLEILDTDGLNAVTNRDGLRLNMINSEAPALIIIGAPISDGALADAACSLFLGQFLQYALSSFNSSAPPILLALDESPRLQDRVDLGSTLSLVAGANVNVLLAAQDISQFDDARRDEILSNCGTMVCLPRVSRATTDYFVGRLGDVYLPTLSRNSGSDGTIFGSHSDTHSVERVAMLGHREIASPPPRFGEWPGMVHCPSLSSQPIVVDLTRADLVA